MGNIKPTKEALLLQSELSEIGIEAKLQHWDGHKHVDLYIEAAKLYIEVDGLNHWLNPKQIISDFNRDHYSDQGGYRTFRVPSFVVLTETKRLAKAICTTTKIRGSL